MSATTPPPHQNGHSMLDETAGDEDLCVRVEQLTPKHRLYERVQKLRSFYRRQFGGEPVFIVKLPGRVNIIGEHVDYCGYPVLPMALDQCILLAVGGPNGDGEATLQLRNMQPDKFGDYDCDLKTLRIELPCKGFSDWYKYYLCGIKGIQEAFPEATRQPRAMCVALDGNVPPAAGLSSSSALVSAAVLATAHWHRLPLDRKQLAALSAQCERYIGTQGGGMDQAIAYLAKQGFAQFIEFEPELRATPVRLPQGACFVVANSLAEKNKAASSDFNERVVECRLGCLALAKAMQLPHWRQINRYAQLQAELQCPLAELEQLVHKEFAPLGEQCSRAQICDLLEIDEAELERHFLTANTLHMNTFKLYPRGLHVVQESMRVAAFRAVCNSLRDASAGEPLNNVNSLTDLMRASHESLRSLYECSHPDLDRLTRISSSVGVGARLTGAGWGGCIVALCESPESSESFIRALKQEYYAQLPSHMLEQHQTNDFADLVFATLPGHGAEIFTL